MVTKMVTPGELENVLESLGCSENFAIPTRSWDRAAAGAGSIFQLDAERPIEANMPPQAGSVRSSVRLERLLRGLRLSTAKRFTQSYANQSGLGYPAYECVTASPKEESHLSTCKFK